MTSTVGAAAKWTVRENETSRRHFVRWEAFPPPGSGHPCVQNERPVHDPVFDAERLHDADGGAA